MPLMSWNLPSLSESEQIRVNRNSCDSANPPAVRARVVAASKLPLPPDTHPYGWITGLRLSEVRTQWGRGEEFPTQGLSVVTV